MPDRRNKDTRSTELPALYDGALLPDAQVSLLRNLDRAFPTRTVCRGGDIRALPGAASPLPPIAFTVGGRTFDLFDYVALNRVTGLLVLHDGRIAYEIYQLGNDERVRWPSMSIAKSITATLIGAAIHDRLIGSMDDDVTRYVEVLKGSAYEGVSIRQLLQMTSGVQWDETYTNRASDRRRMLELQHAQRPGAILTLMTTLSRIAPPGTRWNYSTGETHVAGAVLRAAVGVPLTEYLSARVWSAAGMEADAVWWLESPDGLEVGGSGFSATLRDYGRFGLLLLDDGCFGPHRILPEGWLAEATSSKQVGGARVDYGYMFWPIPPDAGRVHDGAFEALGIFGQHVYVNPAARIVIVVWGALPKPRPREIAPIPDYAFFGAVTQALTR